MGKNELSLADVGFTAGKRTKAGHGTAPCLNFQYKLRERDREKYCFIFITFWAIKSRPDQNAAIFTN